MIQRAHCSLMHIPICDINTHLTHWYVTSQATSAEIIACITSTLFPSSQSTTVEREFGLNPSMLNCSSPINIIYCHRIAVYIDNIVITRDDEEGIIEVNQHLSLTSRRKSCDDLNTFGDIDYSATSRIAISPTKIYSHT